MRRLMAVITAGLLLGGCSQSKLEECQATADDYMEEAFASRSKISELEGRIAELEAQQGY